MSNWLADRPMDDDVASVGRAYADPSVWMCNIPGLDVADGVQAAGSLKKIKAYVEETVDAEGSWARLSKDLYEFRW